MRKLLTAFLIIGSLTGLEAGHHCPCKPKVTKEQKHEKKEKHKAADKKIKEDFKKLNDLDHCYCVKTEPCPKEFNGKIKRDHNGDRI